MLVLVSRARLADRSIIIPLYIHIGVCTVTTRTELSIETSKPTSTIANIAWTIQYLMIAAPKRGLEKKVERGETYW